LSSDTGYFGFSCRGPVRGQDANVTLALAPAPLPVLPGMAGTGVRVEGAMVDRPAARQSRWIGLTNAGVLAFCILLAVVNVLITAMYDGGRPKVIACGVATALYLPPYLAMVWTRVRGRRPSYWLPLAVAVIVFGAFPWAGPLWSRALSAVALTVLITVPVPWSGLGYAVLWIAPIPIMFVGGHPDWWASGVLPVNAVLGLYVLLRLAGSARQLELARQRQAAEAVVRERLRIDEELRTAVGTDLAAIARLAELASTDMSDPATVRARLEKIVSDSRVTLAGARRLIMGYRQPSLVGALDSVVNLLGAAGIRVRIVSPDERPNAAAEERIRLALRETAARLLATDAGAYVLTLHDGGVDVEAELGSVTVR
jgi:hypothetical protein